MRTKLVIQCFLGLILAAVGARAGDAPHDVTTFATSNFCGTCHITHRALGSQLTNATAVSNLCDSCHALRTGSPFGFPWHSDQQAVPDSFGSSHRWDASASSTRALSPSSTALRVRLSAGNLTCAVCHDQHTNVSVGGQHLGTQHLSATTTAPLASTPLTTSSTIWVNLPSATSSPMSYLIEIVTAGTAASASFHVSNDNGATWGATKASASGTPINIATDGSNVSITLKQHAPTGGFTVGQRFASFYIGYPFVRLPSAASTDLSDLCEDCHRDRKMTAANVHTSLPAGSTYFSHPVGEALGSNGGGYDRTTSTIRAVNGSATTTEAFQSNTLPFDANSKVRCLTCHRPHNADSNSLTDDLR
jgi:hypothetical protein